MAVKELAPVTSTDCKKLQITLSLLYQPRGLVQLFCLEVNFHIHNFDFFHEPPLQAACNKFRLSWKNFNNSFLVPSLAHRHVVIFSIVSQWPYRHAQACLVWNSPHWQVFQGSIQSLFWQLPFPNLNRNRRQKWWHKTQWSDLLVVTVSKSQYTKNERSPLYLKLSSIITRFWF